ncbi:MAG: hypothetical protein JOY62_07915 [Acidobacteriaceae bacterium]|nr:hypothetical protein [Acidobacteriaceae bacterium]MBV9779886.1 hypothetical protein [Acidobacteriaceae bacterium]
MKFECGDLERALATPELMPEAREHLKTCAACRREYRVWTDISAIAKELHADWETPALWSNIRRAIETEPRPAPKPVWWKEWKTWAVAAAVVIAAVLVSRPWQWASVQNNGSSQTDAAASLAAPLSSNRDFLTDQALQEVERSEAAYRRSIEKLSQLAEPKLQKSAAPVTVSYREKLLMLDSAITETRTNLAQNQFNVHLQRELADLYREKQQTLQELLTRDQKN